MTSEFPAPARPGVPDWRTAYPFAAHHLCVAGQSMHYVDETPGEASARDGVLLMVHGNPTWSFHWRELIKAWRGRFRVIAPDHLGCGLSGLPAHHSVSLAERIGHLVELIETLDLHHVTLIAHDWGGAIGLGAALATAERFERIVLFNTGAFPPWFIPWRIRLARTPLLGRLAVQGPNLFLRAALRMALADPRVLTPPARAGYLAPYNSWRRRQAIYDFVADIPRSPQHPTYATLANIETGLAKFSDRPLLLVWGMRDWCFTPACLDRFRELLPHAQVHQIESAGHWVVEDARAEVIDRVGTFLTR